MGSLMLSIGVGIALGAVLGPVLGVVVVLVGQALTGRFGEMAGVAAIDFGLLGCPTGAIVFGFLGACWWAIRLPCAPRP